jgi:hypothetical protein
VAAEVSAPGNLNGMLRARSDGIGLWESFELCFDATTRVATLRSLRNGLYVAEENDYAGNLQFMLRARSGTAGLWEQFAWEAAPGGSSAFRSLRNNLYTAMENDSTGDLQFYLRARSAAIGTWESFIVWRAQQ